MTDFVFVARCRIIYRTFINLGDRRSVFMTRTTSIILILIFIIPNLNLLGFPTFEPTFFERLLRTMFDV